MLFRRGIIMDLSGQRFGRWTVVGPGSREGNGTFWPCRCDCGTEKRVARGALRGGTSLSCGCLQVALARRRATTHGRTKSPEYTTWRSMKGRVEEEREQERRNYKDRGIRVCDGWVASFEAFLADMGPRPTREHSIDRKDNDRGYDCGHCPDCISRGATANCRWATHPEQTRNTRSNVWLELDGTRMVLADWARRLGIRAFALQRRLETGMDLRLALTTPAMPRGVNIRKTRRRN